MLNWGKKNSSSEKVKPTFSINACGLQCPGPIMQVYKAMEEMNNGEILEIKATDPGFMKDIKTWCSKTGNTLIEVKLEDKVVKAIIQKGQSEKSIVNKAEEIIVQNQGKDATIVVFSQDMDKAMASFIIASGAAAMGKKVTLFFTFWGLNILRKENSPAVKKDFLEKMFGWMMPKGVNKLPISNMNMAGMGPKMIKHVMKKKNVDSLDLLIKNAMDAGVNIVACAMSMDIMGIKEEELIDELCV